MKTQKRSKVTYPPVAFQYGETSTELLPLPFVSYPGHYGTFFAFSVEDDHSRLLFCKCSQTAIENYLTLRHLKPVSEHRHQQALLDSRNFPLVVSKKSLNVENAEDFIEYADGVCHRCNLTRPSMDYCHPMYGGQFVRAYGWYIRQAFYRFGVEPRASWKVASGVPLYLCHDFLDEVCPSELIKLIFQARDATSRYLCEVEEQKKEAPKTLAERKTITGVDNLVEQNKLLFKDYYRFKREAGQAKRAVEKYVEDFVRQEFGFRKVGEGWVSETLLANLIRRLHQNQNIIRHYRPDWLMGLELDIYMPDMKIGIEYQGQQHFHAIKAWGGTAALIELQERDKRKATLCEESGVCLITISYTEPLIEEHIQRIFAAKLDGRHA